MDKQQLIASLEYLLKDWRISQFMIDEIIKRYTVYIDKIEKGETVV
jgi:hypothetical protein